MGLPLRMRLVARGERRCRPRDVLGSVSAAWRPVPALRAVHAPQRPAASALRRRRRRRRSGGGDPAEPPGEGQGSPRSPERRGRAAGSPRGSVRRRRGGGSGRGDDEQVPKVALQTQGKLRGAAGAGRPPLPRGHLGSAPLPPGSPSPRRREVEGRAGGTRRRRGLSRGATVRGSFGAGASGGSRRRRGGGREVGAEPGSGRGAVGPLVVGGVPPDAVRRGGGGRDRGCARRRNGRTPWSGVRGAAGPRRGGDDKAEPVPWCWVDLAGARPRGGGDSGLGAHAGTGKPTDGLRTGRRAPQRGGGCAGTWVSPSRLRCRRVCAVVRGGEAVQKGSVLLLPLSACT